MSLANIAQKYGATFTPTPNVAGGGQPTGSSPLPTGQASSPLAKMATKYGATFTPVTPPTPDTFGNRANTDIQNAGTSIYNTLNDNTQSPVNRGVQATATAFNTIPQVASEALPASARSGLAALGTKIGAGFSWLTGKIADTSLIKGAAGNQVVGKDGTQTYVPNDTTGLESNLSTASAGGQIASIILAADQATKLLNKVPILGSDVQNVTPDIVNGADTIKNKITNMFNGGTSDTPTVSARDSAWKDIAPKPTDKTVQAYRAQGNTNPKGLLKGVTLNPSGADAKVLDNLAPLYENNTIDPSMPTETKLHVIETNSRALAARADQLVADNNAIVETPEVTDALQAAKETSRVTFGTDKTLEGAYDAPQQSFMDRLLSGKAGATGTDTVSLRNALKSWDAEMRQKFPTLWKMSATGEINPTDNARLNGIMDTHTVIRDLIQNKLGPDVPYASTLSQSSSLIRAGEMLNHAASNTSKVDSFINLVKNHPWFSGFAALESLKHTVAPGLPGF